MAYLSLNSDVIKIIYLFIFVYANSINEIP